MFSYQRKLFQHLEQVCRSDLIDGRKHGQEVSFVQAQVIEEVHGGHPPASLKLAMFSLLPILKEARHGSRVRYFRQKTPSSKFISSSTICLYPFRFFISLYYFVLSTCASMKSGKFPICDCKKGQATTVARMAVQHTRELIV